MCVCVLIISEFVTSSFFLCLVFYTGQVFIGTRGGGIRRVGVVEENQREFNSDWFASLQTWPPIFNSCLCVGGEVCRGRVRK